MIPEYISIAFPHFKGKELQIIYAISKLMENGCCSLPVPDIAYKAGVRRKTATTLIKNLEILKVLVVDRIPGKAPVICFGDAQSIKQQCDGHINDLLEKRRNQTKIAREVKVGSFNNLSRSTTGVVQRPDPPLIIDKENKEVDKKEKKEEKRRRGRVKEKNGKPSKQQKSSSFSAASQTPSVSEQSMCEAVFEIYSQQDWSVQKTWHPRFSKKEKIRRHCQILYEQDCADEYFSWIHFKLVQIEEETGKKYSRYFATTLAEAWFNDFFD